MDSVRIIEIKESVFADNDREADRVRAKLKEEKTFLLNLMSSPGSGKTTTLLRTIERLKDDLRIGVMEADIDSSVDAETVARAGVKSIQLHTGGMCHLDAGMTRQGLEGLGVDDIDFAILENVGNLVCLIINKIDVLPYFDFDMDKVREYALRRNPRLEIFPISAKTGEGVEAWTNWLKKQVRDWTEE